MTCQSCTRQSVLVLLGNHLLLVRPATRFHAGPRVRVEKYATRGRPAPWPVPNVPVPGAPPRGPVFNTFPQPQVVNPQVPQSVPPVQAPAGQQTPAGQPSPTPVAPYGGVSVPGMVAPPPPTAPGQPPVRRPGGPGGN